MRILDYFPLVIEALAIVRTQNENTENQTRTISSVIFTCRQA
jgi:hypothetical protein